MEIIISIIFTIAGATIIISTFALIIVGKKSDEKQNNEDEKNGK